MRIRTEKKSERSIERKKMMFGEKKLGFGLMRLPLLDENEKGSIDIGQTKKMVDVFMERGFTYFDTAWMYCAFNSENAVKEALVDRYPRDSYTLATKLHAAYIKSREDRDRIFEEQRRKTGVSYFDYYLIHAIDREMYQTYEELDCFEWLIEKKRQGLVKHIGFSFHDDAEFLEQVIREHPEFEFVQLQINYLDWKSEQIQSEKCYETAVKYGKPVIVMEPVKGGKLAQVPENVRDMFRECRPEMSVSSWAVRFAAGLENVKMVLSGMSNLEQLMDNTGFMSDFTPLDERERKVLEKAAHALKDNQEIPCTSCSYCTEGCPANIAIPQYFALYNRALQEGKEAVMEDYAKQASLSGKASECIACGQCESACPQHLTIIDHLKACAAQFE